MLAILSMGLVGLVALEHIYILYMEMFAWTSARVRRSFGTTPEFARDTRALAANQGLYNGFLAAGLIWGLLHPNTGLAFKYSSFFSSA